MIYAISIGILAIIWDIYALNHWKHSDKSVSEFIYKLCHRFPIIAMVATALVVKIGNFSWREMIILAVGGLFIHFTWKA